jgi:exodeoxyribonuclease VII large subunit
MPKDSPTLFDHKPEGVLTVSQFLDTVNELLTALPARVRGEVTGWHVHQTGVYFSLKDKEDGALMDCYMSPFVWRGLGMEIQDGMEVVVAGASSIYKPKGRFSLRVESLELVGEGSLKKAYELLKKKLEQEGLFERKRPLPEFITKVGVITSRTGAVIQDFRKNLAKLGLEVNLYDTRVEGAKAVDGILGALKWFNNNMPELDVLVIIRGGGSLEDLQAFNNEHVSRELFASKIPTLCSIGHEKDVPIAQLVADESASTPTATAVRINQSWDRLYLGLPRYGQRLVSSFGETLLKYRNLLDIGSMLALFERNLSAFGERLSGYEKYLSAASPERQLKLGYSIITDGSGRVIKDAVELKIGQDITARLSKGEFAAEVKDVKIRT